MPDIVHSIPISAEAAVIYPLVSTGRGMSQWWAADVQEDGGAVELGFFKRQTVYRIRRQQDQPPQDVEWVCETGDEWNGTRLIFHLDSRDKQIWLRFTHAGWRTSSDYFLSCNTTWGELMYRLKAAAEGKSRGPLFLAAELAY